MEILRLQKYLAQCGVASRREAERLIESGRVQVNGVTVSEMGYKVQSQDKVLLDGKPIKEKAKVMYIMMNKPEDCVVTRSDPQGRRTVYHFLPKSLHHLHPVGRLDRNSCGLLLLTNEGELTQKLLHPRYKMPKRYRVHVTGKVDKMALARLRGGINLEEGKTQPARVTQLPAKKLPKGSHVLEFILEEGKKRQIRRMCKAVNLRVTFLQRQAIGPLVLEGLEEEKYRPLRNSELKALKRGMVSPR